MDIMVLLVSTLGNMERRHRETMRVPGEGYLSTGLLPALGFPRAGQHDGACLELGS